MTDTNTSQNSQCLLEIKDLEVGFYLRQGLAKAINHLNLTINRGETLGLIGESGCGKSVTSLAILNLIPDPGRILGGEVLFEGTNLLKLGKRAIRKIRGNRIGMIFQEPMTALNPVLTIGDQLTEALILHRNMTKKEALEKTAELLDEVGLPNPKRQLRAYPHELSGGMRQRAMIAGALSTNPDLLIADEPTTALDVTIQAQILELIKKIQESHNIAVLMITHDMGIISEMADRVAVMYAGDVVETAEVKTLFGTPNHPYTRGLMKAIPHIDDVISENGRLYNIPGAVPTLLELPIGCRFQERCPLVDEACKKEIPKLETYQPGHLVRCLHYTKNEPFVRSIATAEEHRDAIKAEKNTNEILLDLQNVKTYFPVHGGLFRKVVNHVRAVDDISLFIKRKETLGLVGESGCGKSTIGRTILNLAPHTGGKVFFEGEHLENISYQNWKKLRTRMQMVFQNPMSSLNPRMTVQEILVDAPFYHEKLSRDQKKQLALKLVDYVGLNKKQLQRFPHEFSGGQRQRICVAKALSLNPSLLICDEPVSALDVSIQAQILNLFKDLQKELDVTYLFISHDLGVVRFMADRIAVMYLGKIVEIAEKETLFSNPQHPYTVALLSAIPKADPTATGGRIILEGDVPSPTKEYTGCSFAERCPRVKPECNTKLPMLETIGSEHFVSCFHPTNSTKVN